MAWTPEKLKKVREDVDNGTAQSVSVRELLQWFGSYRRGRHVVAQIRSSLRDLDLITVPDFDATWIYGSVRFKRSEPQTQPVAPVVTTTVAEPNPTTALPSNASTSPPAQEPPHQAESPVRTLEGQDPSYSVGKLEAANRSPVTANPNMTITEAVTIMLAHDFSQLPVMQGERSVKGLFSWKSLGSRLAMKRPCEKVADAMDIVRTISAEASIFQVADILADDEVVLVQASATDNKVVGIVTTADMAKQFGSLGEPFLLLGEIENRVRVLIDGKFTLEALKAAKNPTDTEREVESVADLTFGEYVRLLQEPASWEKCKLGIDRGTFIKHLEEARDVRNDVMHFEPEGIGDEGLERLRQFARFLARIAQLNDV